MLLGDSFHAKYKGRGTRKTEYTVYELRKSNMFVCVEVLRPSQPNGVMSSTVSLPNHTFTGQA